MAKYVRNDPVSSAGGLVIAEIFFISILLGTSQKSWWIFGACLFGLLFLALWHKTALIFGIAATLGWGWLGWKIGEVLFKDLGASVVIGLILLIVTGIYHALVVLNQTKREGQGFSQ